jgi:uncharacterized protein (TIGR03067 family)
MNWKALLVLAAGVTASAAQEPGGRERKRELDRIQGGWVITGGESEGRPLPGAMFKDLVLVVEGERVVVLDRGERRPEDDMTIRLDPTKSPKQIDISTTIYRGTADERVLTFPGIYSLERDTLTVCLDDRMRQRPKGFSTKGAPGCSLQTWKRR